MENKTINNPKILIIVPAYNEAENIVEVVESLKTANPAWQILVINDYSNDLTGMLAKTVNNVKVVDLPCNLGIGGAVQTGFVYARENGYEIAVQFDGDGQHIANEIDKIIKPIFENRAGVVIGSRFLEKNNKNETSKWRKLGIKIFEMIYLLLIRQRFTDSTSGFRAYNRKSIELLAEYYPMDFPEPEAIIWLIINKIKIEEVQVQMKSRQGGISSISGIKPVYYMVKVLLSILMSILRTTI